MTTEQQLIDALKPLLDELVPTGDFRTLQVQLNICNGTAVLNQFFAFPVGGTGIMTNSLSEMRNLVTDFGARKAKRIAELEAQLAELKKPL